MGKKLATGGFGTVYKAELFEDDDLVEQENPRPVIVKKVFSLITCTTYLCLG